MDETNFEYCVVDKTKRRKSTLPTSVKVLIRLNSIITSVAFSYMSLGYFKELHPVMLLFCVFVAITINVQFRFFSLLDFQHKLTRLALLCTNALRGN